MVSNPLPFIGELAKDSMSLTASSIATSVRMAGKSEELLEEAILTLRAARPVINALAEAIDAGLLDDFKVLLGTVAESQDDVRAARESVERLVSLINTTLDSVGGVPGAQLILKGIARVSAGTKSAIPVSLVTEPQKPAKNPPRTSRAGGVPAK
jgi:hypothetical protein